MVVVLVHLTADSVWWCPMRFTATANANIPSTNATSGFATKDEDVQREATAVVDSGGGGEEIRAAANHQVRTGIVSSVVVLMGSFWDIASERALDGSRLGSSDMVTRSQRRRLVGCGGVTAEAGDDNDLM